MKQKLLKILVGLLLVSTLLSTCPITLLAEGENGMYITDLKVNNLVEPLGIDKNPTFRWINHFDGYARSQSAYRIIVASSAEKAAAHDGDVWDSGKVVSNLNYDIAYDGNALASATEYFFAVQVWDEKDNSVWSDVSKFETGFLSDSEWSAKWIGITDGDSVPCDIDLSGANWIWFKDGAATSAAGNVYFRKYFTVDKEKEVDEVLLATTMDDYGNLFVNDECVLIVKNLSGEWKNGKVVNITSFVNKGENVFAAGVTNTGSSAGFVAKIEIRYTDGSVDTVVTDASWKCSNSVGATSGWERRGINDTAWVAPDQCAAYGVSPWKNLVVMPENMQVNVGAGAPMLRKTFEISKDVSKARIYISGLGLYDLYVNGEHPDDTVLNPAHTQYEDTVHYRAYDVTDMLSSGKNAIAVELGNFFYNCDFYGWMKWSLAVYRDNPKLLLELHIDYTDGTSEVIVTDESWKTYEYGPIYYNNVYKGEHYDARREVDGWTEASFDDSAWRKAKLADAPTGDLVFENMEPIRRIKTFVPTVENKGAGTYIIHNPVMTSGWAKIKFNAPAGTEIKITYGEKLNDLGFVVPTVNGFLLQVDKFITSGGDDVYEPKYSYKGYEYIQIENYSGELDASDVECYLIANDIPDISEFETGDSRINFMHEMMLRTVMNNLQGKLTDTPVYEKNGWTGDVNFALDSFNYNYDFSNVIQKILIDMRDSQNEKGVVAQNVPAAFSGGSNIPVWTSIFINGYYENWHVNGNKTAFAENYDAIRLQTLEYIRAIKANGWVWTTGGYSDWVSPNPSGVLISGHTTHAPEGTGIIGSAFVYRTLGEMAEMADYLGKSADAEEYRAAMANIYTAFNEKFYLADKGYYDTGFWNETYDAGRSKYRQASNIIPLMFGLCPKEYEASVVKSIVDDIKAKDNHLDVGAVGTKFILPMLSKYGYSDLAMALVQQDTYPSWGYWINLGANTCWETYEYNSRSRNHFFLGTYTDWFYKNLAGVRDFTNGYETVELRPEIHPEIGYVSYTFKTVRGELGSHWRFTEDNKLIWDITVPVGTTATVYLPASADISEYPCITDNGENLTVPSGNYTFVMDAAEFGVDKSLLKKAVDNAKTFDKTVYTKKDFANFSAVVTECEAVLADANATQFEVCKAVDALEIAVEGLSFDTDRKELSLLIASGESLKADNYPSDVFEAFLQVLENTKSVLANENADENSLEEAYTELYTAMYTIADSCSGNVALGKEVLATSDVVSDYWGKQKITDGNRLNLRGKEVCGWSSSDLTAFNHSETVCVDLGAFYKINKVNIMPAGAIVGAEALAFPSDFAIYGSLDGESWELLYGEKDYPVPFVELQEFRFEPAKVRYIRFTGTSLRQKPTDGNRFRMQIAEFEAYNTENEVDSGNVAYVADGGTGDGRSASSPTSDINVAYALLGESGGTIVFVGEYTTSATVDFPEHTAKVKLTSVHGIDYRLTSDAAIRYAGTGFIKFNGPTEIDGLTVKLDKSSAGFCANFNPVTVGYDFAVVNTDGTTAYRMYFVGGQNGENKGGALGADKTNEIKIYSGKFVMVSAFSRSVALSHSGTVTVTIGGTADVRDLYFGAMGTGAKGGTGIVYLKEKAKVTNAFLSGNTVGMNGSAILRMEDATSVSVFKNSSASCFANGKRELYYTDTVTLPSGFEAHFDTVVKNEIIPEDPSVVYVDGTGMTSGAYATLQEAVDALHYAGGTIVISGNTSVSNNPIIAEQVGDLTITSINGAKLLLTSRLTFAKNTNSNVITLDCPVDTNTKTNGYIFGGFNNVVITDKFVVTNSGGGKLDFFGGVYTALAETDADCIADLPYSITVNGGTFNIFAGGSYRVSVKNHMSSIAAPVEITVNGGTFGNAGTYPISANNTNLNGNFSISGNSILADNATLIINGGTFEVPVVAQGGMNAVEAGPCEKATTIGSDKKYYAIDGDISVVINGGTFNGGYVGASYTQAAYTSLVRGNFDVTVNGGDFKADTVFDATQVKAYNGRIEKATITYPNDKTFTVRRFDVVNGATVEYEDPIRVAFIGDSITEGYAPAAASVNRLTEGYPAAFTKYCEAAGKDVIVSNYGVASAGFMDSLARSYGKLIAWKMVREETDPDIVFFAMGTNDAASSSHSHGGMQKFEENLMYYVTEMGKLASVDKIYVGNALFRNTSNALADHNVSATIRDTQERVARQLANTDSKYVFFDLYGLTLSAALDDSLFKDDKGVVNERLHPARAGLDMMGLCCYNAAFNGVVEPEEYRLCDIYVSDNGTPYGKGTKESPISDINYAFSLMKPDAEVTLHILDTVTYTGERAIFPSTPSKLNVVGEVTNAKIVLPNATAVLLCTDVKFDKVTLQAGAAEISLFGYYNSIEITKTVKTVGTWSFYAGYNANRNVSPSLSSVFDDEKSVSASNDCTVIISGGTFDGFMLGNYRVANNAPYGTYSGRMEAFVDKNAEIGNLVTKTGIVGQNYLAGHIDVTVSSWGESVVRTYASHGTGVDYDESNNTGTVNIAFGATSYVADSDNLAYEKSVDVSSSVNADSVITLTDGDVTSVGNVWSSAVSTDKSANEWVIVDLGSVCTFNQVNALPNISGSAAPLCEGFPTDFTISVSKDGKEWETVVTLTDYSASYAMAQEFMFDTVDAQYVKFEASTLGELSGGEYAMQLAELEVYNVEHAPEISGDFDGDGTVTVIDALLLIRTIVNNDHVKNSDVNGDGKVGLADVIRVMKMIAQ